MSRTFRPVIPKRNTECSKKGTPLEPEMEYISVLIPEGEDYQRLDFCLESWEEDASTHYGQQGHTIWKSRVPTKKEKEEAVVKQEDGALPWLKDLLESSTLEDKQLAFVLAIYLERGHEILLRKEKEGLRFYEVAGTEEMLQLEVFDPGTLPLDQIQEKLQERLKDHGK